MKLLNRKEFMALPDGVFYYPFVGSNPQHLTQKTETLNGDWVEREIAWPDFGDLDAMGGVAHLENGVEFPLDLGAYCRNGRFDDSDAFLVLDENDVLALAAALAASVGAKVTK